MNNIIIMALPEEAPALSSRNDIFFTGVGKVNAAATTAMLIERHKPRRIINFGTAGGITVSSGLHQVGKFVQRDINCVPLGFAVGQTPYEDDILLELSQGLTCGTGDSFVTDPNLAIPVDLVDMEAYAIAKLCHKHNIEFLCYKFVSDSANESAPKDWTEMISSGQTHYINKLNNILG